MAGTATGAPAGVAGFGGGRAGAAWRRADPEPGPPHVEVGEGVVEPDPGTPDELRGERRRARAIAWNTHVGRIAVEVHRAPGGSLGAGVVGGRAIAAGHDDRQG